MKHQGLRKPPVRYAGHLGIGGKAPEKLATPMLALMARVLALAAFAVVPLGTLLLTVAKI
jgi:hypothetical protein